VGLLRDAMSRGEWKERLPSERMLAEMLRVSRMTVRKALVQLEAEGLIAPNPGNAQRRITRRASLAPLAAAITVSIVRRPDLLAVTDLDLWQHRLQLRLAQMGVPSEVFFFSNRQLNSRQLDPQNWTAGKTRRFWILVGSTPEMQRWFAKHAPGETLVVGTSLPASGLPFIDRDYRAVGRHACGFILGRQHRRIALLGLKQPVIGDRETEAGLQEEIAAHRDAQLIVMRHDGSKNDVYRQIDRLLDRSQPPTALFVYKASLTLAAIVRLMQRGVRIPEQLSVVARDENPGWAMLPFGLAHYSIRPDEIVDHVTARVREHFDSPGKALPSVRILSQFRPGNSVARLPSM
jgi:hypothetical protein